MSPRAANLRAAVVGAGLMGRWHARELTHLGYTLAAVVDIDESKAGTLAADFPACKVFRTLSDAFLNDDFDVVHICTPSESHVSIAEQAIEAGAAVLMEKPLAPDLQTTQRLLALAESKRVLLAPVHQFVYQRGVIEAQKQLPNLTGVLHVDYTACSAGATGLTPAEHERIALDILPHPLSLLARFVSCHMDDYHWQVIHSGMGEIKCFATCRGTAISLTISMQGRPTRNNFRLIGYNGSLHLDLFHGYCVSEGGTVSRLRKLLHPFALSSATLLNAGGNLARRTIEKEQAYPGLRMLIRQFYGALQERRSVPFTSEEVLFVAEARDELVRLLTRKPSTPV